MKPSDPLTNYVKPNPEAIAEWVPAAVRKAAPFWNIDEGALPLLTDARMKNVWRELLQQELVDPAIFDTPYFEHAKRFLLSDGDNFSSAEIGCVAFFDRAAGLGRALPVTKAQMAERLAPWQSAAKLLHAVEAGPVPAFDAELAAALPIVRKYLEQNAASMEAQLMRFAMERSRGEELDAARNYGARLVAVTTALFGTPLYGTVATVTTVITGVKVTRSMVESWVAK
jgi:hypothetical protein